MNKLRLSGIQYQKLQQHLFPGDGKEAVAVALCGRSESKENTILTVRELLLIPYNDCYEREVDLVRWPTHLINELLEKAGKSNGAIVKFHCHPGGGEFFSEYDDESDNELFLSTHSWLESSGPHGSCIMLPDGRLFGRFFFSDMSKAPIDSISIAGDDIIIWRYNDGEEFNAFLQKRNLQAFGKKTVELLSGMTVGVVGASGTGSIVIEQLKRFGVGRLIIVEPETIDAVNLNRIIGATLEDAEQSKFKVDVMKREIDKVGFRTEVIAHPTIITDYKAVKDLAQCDALFGCVDSSEGRHMVNLIGTYYLLPLFDLGVHFDADGSGGIEGIFATVHYIQPGKSSLLSRGVYSMRQVSSEGSRRLGGEAAEKNQYLLSANESAPAVISVNMAVAAAAVNELLARIHPYRSIGNNTVDSIRLMYSEATSFPEEHPDVCAYFEKYVGRGDIEPLLNCPELSKK